MCAYILWLFGILLQSYCCKHFCVQFLVVYCMVYIFCYDVWLSHIEGPVCGTLTEKNWVGVCHVHFSKPLAKLCDFQSPIYDLTLNQDPVSELPYCTCI